MEPDRLAEEQRRGLTIDLGFAWTVLPSGRKIGFVDVPGHERFVRNMLAGCGGANAALLVVSAREGWKPQTEEHVEILDLLGVPAGVIAISHVDVVDSQTADHALAQTHAMVEGTFLQHAPVVLTSLTNPASIERLRRAIDDVITSVPEPGDQDRPRLWIDRSFTLPGAGRIVTGTLTGGSLSVDEDVTLAPSPCGKSIGRIRGIHTFGEPATHATAGSRVALNLSRLHSQPARGQGVVRGEQWSEGHFLHVALRPVRSLIDLPRTRAAYSIVVGTRHTTVRLRYLAQQSLLPDQRSVIATLNLADILAPVGIGDRFILRDESASTTVAGGTILAVDTTEMKYDPVHLAACARALTEPQGTPRVVALTSAFLKEHDGVIDTNALMRCIGTAHSPGIVRVRDVVMLAARYSELRAELLSHTVSGQAELRRDAAARAVVEQLAHEGLLQIRHNMILRTDARDSTRNEIRERIEMTIHDAVPPLLTRGELCSAAGVDGYAISEFVACGALVEVGDFVTTSSQYKRYSDLVAASLAGQPKPTSELREALGLSRRFAVPVLESLDRSGLTRRAGSLRNLRREPSDTNSIGSS
jgi:selenocysteine-specific elongation factor